MNIEKISSLHDDPLEPKVAEHMGEYRDYPERFDPSEKSVLTRLEQFGVDIPVAEELFGKKITEFNWEEYLKLIGETIKTRHDVMVGSVFDQYMFPNPESPDDDQRRREMMKLFKKYEGMREGARVNLIKRKADFKESGNLVLCLEAGAHLIRSTGDVKKLADHGVRIFGLQYSKDNPLATNNEGLTELGVKTVRYLFDHNLIIDLAHSSYKTRQDVMQLAQDLGKGNLISYTHGSSEEDIIGEWKTKIGERALKKEEIDQIISMGGIIGLGVTQPFFSGTRKIAERIDETTQIDGGIDRIAIGTDFGGVSPMFLNDIRNPDDLKKLGDALSEQFGMSDEDINKILRSNAKEWIKKAIQ